MKKIIVGFLLFFSMATYAANDTRFYYRNNVINPACVALFNSSTRDLPYVRAVGINGCYNSHLLRTEHRDGNQFFIYNNDKDNAHGRYAYEIIGKTSSGIYVLHTLNQPSTASNIYDMLLFVRLERGTLPIFNDTMATTTAPSFYAMLVGFVQGGDRCSGGIQSASVQGNTVAINRYPSRNSVGQCQGAQSFNVNLAKY